MEITAFQMYWFVKLDDIRSLFCIVGVLGSIIFGASVLYSVAENKFKRFKTLTTFLILYLFIFSMVFIVPSTRQLAAILIVPKVINNERVQDVPDKILTLGLEWLEGLRPEVKEK